MNSTATEVAARIAREVGNAPIFRTIAGAYVRALIAHWRGAHWVPAGGSSPLGVLGQVAAGIELARQVERGVSPAPQRIVLPLGTGGTAAGLALGTALVGLRTEIVAIRVVPRLVANAGRVQRLASRTAQLLGSLTGASHPVEPAQVRIVHDFYGGAYGRALPVGEEAAALCLAHANIAIDSTYAAKALAAAVAIARSEGGTTLFWLSFDGRWLSRGGRVALR
jgi:D-cysteine desulfhydrase